MDEEQFLFSKEKIADMLRPSTDPQVEPWCMPVNVCMGCNALTVTPVNHRCKLRVLDDISIERIVIEGVNDGG